MQDGTGTYSYSYDEVSRMHTAITPAGKTITYAFDALGQRSSMIDPDGGRFTYAYDSRGLISHLLNPQADRTSFAYDAASRRTVKKLANGTRASFSYDAADNLTLLANLKSDGTTISSFEYVYDSVGNRTHVVEANGDRVTWSHDKTYQLTNERRSGANAYDTTYSYDPAGNRLVKNDSGTRTTYAYDDANQLETTEEAGGTTTYTFDANGNQQLVTEPTGDRTTYTWDFDNRTTLIQLPSGIRNTMAYEPDGLRVRLDESTGTKKFIWDGQAYLTETDQADATIVVYTNEPTSFGNLISQRRDGGTSTYHFDGIGSARVLTDAVEATSDTYLNDAFGHSLAVTGSTSNAFRYIGALGYYVSADIFQVYVRGRSLDPMDGRWLSPDPYGFGLDDYNVYQLVHGNPVANVDPSGSQPIVTLPPLLLCALSKCEQAIKAHLRGDFGKIVDCAIRQKCLTGRGQVKCEACDDPRHFGGYRPGSSPDIRICEKHNGLTGPANILNEAFLEEAYHAVTICDGGTPLDYYLKLLNRKFDALKPALSKDRKICATCLGREMLAKRCASDRAGTGTCSGPANQCVASALHSCVDVCSALQDKNADDFNKDVIVLTLVAWWPTLHQACQNIDASCRLLPTK